MERSTQKSLALLALLMVGMAALVLPMTGLPKETPGLWLWSFRGDQAATKLWLAEPRPLYVFQGELGEGPEGYWHDFQGPTPGSVPAQAGVRLVFRINQLVPADLVAARFEHQRALWEEEDATPVLGLQIDHDSPSSALESYALWLEDLRSFLPPATDLSITGLPDWLVSGDPDGLDALAEAAGSIAFMFYDSSGPLPQLATYRARLEAMDIPFQIGSLTHQADDRELTALRETSGYRGTVLFLTLGERP